MRTSVITTSNCSKSILTSSIPLKNCDNIIILKKGGGGGGGNNYLELDNFII